MILSPIGMAGMVCGGVRDYMSSEICGDDVNL